MKTLMTLALVAALQTTLAQPATEDTGLVRYQCTFVFAERDAALSDWEVKVNGRIAGTTDKVGRIDLELAPETEYVVTLASVSRICIVNVRFGSGPLQKVVEVSPKSIYELTDILYEDFKGEMNASFPYAFYSGSQQRSVVENKVKKLFNATYGVEMSDSLLTGQKLLANLEKETNTLLFNDDLDSKMTEKYLQNITSKELKENF